MDTNGPSSPSASGDNKSMSNWWRLLGVVFGFVFFLFATDSFEIKTTEHGELENGDVTVKVTPPLSDNTMNGPPDNSNISPPSPAENNNPPSPDTSSSGESGSSPASSSVPSITKHQYTRRAQPYPEDLEAQLKEKWGEWTFDKPRTTDLTDLYLKYPHRDVPYDEFPASAWQKDTEYLAEFLKQGQLLVNRTMRAIMEEYGVDSMEMWELTHYDLTVDTPPARKRSDSVLVNGGWTTDRSWRGLKKRLLHAIVTESPFVFAMGGHSSSAGHGNHFIQSYTSQVQWILEAVFARLGVKHTARNFGNGGLGTAHNGLAASSIYGPDLDILMWDSGMTEKELTAPDMMGRQAVLGGVKVPLIYNMDPNILRAYEKVGIDVAYKGSGSVGIPTKEVVQDVEAAPWATKNLRCSGEANEECKKLEYNGTCWIERDDVPLDRIATQQSVPGGRASWHPGNRVHQLTGRIIAMTILQALAESLQEWSQQPNYKMDDDQWHVGTMYAEQKEAMKQLSPGESGCGGYSKLSYLCTVPFQGRTEFGPRNLPSMSNVRNLMPIDLAETIGTSDQPVYQPPDVFNPLLHAPLGEIDVLKIVELGNDFQPVLHDDFSWHYKLPKDRTTAIQKPGTKFVRNFVPGDDRCDGTIDSWCNRGPKSTCLLSGHNDNRGGIIFNSNSGWVVLRPTIKYGYVVAKLEMWHTAGEPLLSEESDSEASDRFRHLKSGPPPYCEGFQFEISIDGSVTTLDYDEFMGKNYHKIQRVVELVPLLEDPNYIDGEDEKEIEVAFRVVCPGQDVQRAFSLTHFYYA